MGAAEVVWLLLLAVMAGIGVGSVLRRIFRSSQDAQPARRSWENERLQWPDGQPRPFTEGEGFQPVTLDQLRGQFAARTAERAVFDREGGFRLVPKKRRKNGRRKWKNR